MAKYKAWIMLFLAIILEITGTALMKNFSLQSWLIGYIFMLSFMIVSYFALSKAIISIPISTAYAVWEGIGLIGTAFVAWLVFQETMPLTKIIAFVIILTGLTMVKLGTTTTINAKAMAKIEGEVHE